jgi:hypothetical protein
MMGGQGRRYSQVALSPPNVIVFSSQTAKLPGQQKDEENQSCRTVICRGKS